MYASKFTMDAPLMRYSMLCEEFSNHALSQNTALTSNDGNRTQKKRQVSYE